MSNPILTLVRWFAGFMRWFAPKVFPTLFIFSLLSLLIAISLPQFASMTADSLRTKRAQENAMRASNRDRRTVDDARRAGRLDPENGKPYDLTFFESHGTNPFVATEDDPAATFGMDVDTASWGIAKRFLADGQLPDRDAVRVEEFIQSLPQAYPPARDLFGIDIEGAESGFGRPRYRMLRVGVRARDLSQARLPANVVFVVDISGSMDREDRLGLVKRSLALLLDTLRPDDRLGLVVYGDRGRILCDLTSDHDRIAVAIDALAPGGSTNAEAGLTLAYAMARDANEPGRISRIVLCTDGLANVGTTGGDGLLASVKADALKGVLLTCLGFGMGNYNDVLLETLADHGDGRYHYVNDLAEARRLFENGALALLDTVASDARIQVTFDPAAVDRYRLLGYENRAMADQDFRNDQADAGEVAPGETVTALFELRLRDDVRGSREATLATVRVRAVDLETRRPVESERRVTVAECLPPFEAASPRFRLTAAMAEFAELLRGSYWAQDGSYAEVLKIAERAVLDLRNPALVDLELVDQIRLARDLSSRLQARK